MRCIRTLSALRHVAAGAALAVLAGVGTASASGLPPEPGPPKAPVSYSVAGPENVAASGARPASGSSPSAGTGYKYGSYWRVVTPDVVLRNTVTDPDGGTVNLTFEVWTTDSSGSRKTRSS